MARGQDQRFNPNRRPGIHLIGESLDDSSALIGAVNPRKRSPDVPLIGELPSRINEPLSALDREQKRLLGRVVTPGIEGYEHALKGLMSYVPQRHTVSKMVDLGMPDAPKITPVKGETKSWVDPSIMSSKNTKSTKKST